MTESIYSCYIKLMVKNIGTIKSPTKKIIRIVLLVLFAPVLLFILICLWFIVTNPIMDKFDHDKFTKLDTQMQKVFKDIQTASNGADDWKYSAVCIANKSGWMETGDFNCVTSISTQKEVTSVQEINDLQSKYYPIVDNSNALSVKTDLDPELPNDFGRNFVVSSAEKRYIEKDTRIGCKYLIKLYQSVENTELTSDAYGSAINTGVGKALVSLRCSETANKAWYRLSDTANLIVP